MTTRLLRAALAAAAVAITVAGCQLDPPAVSTTTLPVSTVTSIPAPGPAPTSPVTRSVLDVLRGLRVVDNPPRPDRDKTRPPDQTYNRDRDWQPDPEWGRPDRDSCDTRERVLKRDALPGTLGVGPQCRPTGVWPRVYVDGEVSNPSLLQIDHVVSLSDAWRSGGHLWLDRSAATHEQAVARMLAFTQDETNLWAVDKGENGRKNDKGPADWQPPRAAAGCEYARRYVAVKAAYGLSITSRDRDAAGRLLETCPG